jgi:GMP synthase-like glutamine amidotransferase
MPERGDCYKIEFRLGAYKMAQKNILILDYSTDKSETPAIKRWLPADAQVMSLFIDSEESFPSDLIDQGFTHVIHTGSALSITKPAPFTQKAVTFIWNARDKGISQMGICYGHQLVCKALVGNHAVRSSPNGLEAGWGAVTFSDNARQLLGVRESEVVWQHHFDEVTEVPDGSEFLATNLHTKIQAYVNYEQRLFGTQFHPEFDRETGNELYLEDRQLLERNNHNVDDMIKGGPSIEAGKIFFGYFLNI